jgi:hypothetical protein
MIIEDLEFERKFQKKREHDTPNLHTAFKANKLLENSGTISKKAQRPSFRPSLGSHTAARQAVLTLPTSKAPKQG